MKRILIFASLGEAATGVALLIVPSLVGQLLLGEELTGVAIPVARVAGIALIALGIACWPGSDTSNRAFRGLGAMLCYSLLVTLYLVYLGIGGEWVGILLWPAAAVHAVFTLLLVAAWRNDRQSPGRSTP